MVETNPIELRVELYSDDGLSPEALARVQAMLTARWPVVWDVTHPEKPTLDHPLRWRAVIPLRKGTAPEGLHRELESSIRAAALSPSLHLRTRWALPSDPNHQEVYEVRWSAQKGRTGA
ncbi:MAG: hypothetical protein ACYCPN_03700 [Thermoplasmata archaeon]